MKTVIIVIAVVALGAGSVGGQGRLDLHALGFGSTGFHETVASPGDLDGDGVADVVVGDGGFVGGAATVGAFAVYSGVDGSLISLVTENGTQSAFGSVVAALRDLDGDGVNDFAIGAPYFAISKGKAFVYSGASRALLFSVTGPNLGDFFGSVIAALGDIDGDMVPDVAISAPGGTPQSVFAGYVRIVSGVNGSTISTISTGLPNFGFDVVGLDDVNGDQVPDLAISNPLWMPAGTSLRYGAVWIISGINGAMLLEHTGTHDLESFGRSIARIDDVTGDGIGDLLVGAPGYWNGANTTGRLEVFDPVTGAIVYHVLDPTAVATGAEVNALGDVDGDGLLDYVAEDANTQSPGFVVRTAASGALVATSGSGFLDSVVGVGDVNGDGFDDLAGVFNDGGNAPITRVFGVCGIAPYGTGLSLNQALSTLWLPGVSGTISQGTIRCTGAAASAPGLVVVSTSRDFSQALAGPLIDLTPGSFAAASFNYDGLGMTALAIDLRSPQLAGTLWHVQFGARGSAVFSPSYVVSRGLTVLFAL